MTSGYYCAIFPFCGGGKKKKKKKDDKKTKAFYDWATTGIPVMIMLLHLTRVDDVICFKRTSFLFLVQKKRLEVNVGKK